MLTLDGQAFCLGRAEFLASISTKGRTNRVYVRFVVDGIEEPFMALLDTGAEHSWLSREIAEVIGLTEAEGVSIIVGHKEGRSPGKLVRASITLVADKGDSLTVQATVFVPDEGAPEIGNFIGYSGFLERVRLGLDPQENHIYFGGY